MCSLLIQFRMGSRQQARTVAEAAREKEWRGESFLKELFLGRLRLDLIEPHPIFDLSGARPEFRSFYLRLDRFLQTHVDPQAIDETGEYPSEVLEGLAELGAFGMKIPVEYGGLGLSHPEYVAVMRLLGSYDANITALLSAHQAIGVPQPVKLFGSEHLKEKYLPRCARGAISAFALTEPAVGSDPGKLSTIAEASEDGKFFVLNGTKLWCTNGTLADVIVVMARDPATDRINAFVVETAWPGVRVEHRCRFMGLKALGNAVISFSDVKIPRENLIGREGAGLKIALITLNTGRLSLPAATSGAAKLCLEICRKWSCARIQWGAPIGKHEAVAHKLADMAATAFAMEALADLVGDLADRPKTDIRLEAAAAKEWNTTRGYALIDEALQIRGGRGYETEGSLEARGEPPIGIERMLRDARINLIFEGSSEIMHLFIAREALDEHLAIAGPLVDPEVSPKTRLRLLPKVILYYAKWYPRLWLGWSFWPRFRRYGKRLAGHVRFAERAARRLARSLFHGMVFYGPALERKQAFLFRAVDAALEIFAMTAAAGRARRMLDDGLPEAESAERLADVFCRGAKTRIVRLLRDLWLNDDMARYDLARRILKDEYTWLERGTMGLPYEVDALRPATVEAILAARAPSRVKPRPATDHRVRP